MTVTVRGDGILYSDGTLQTTASTSSQGAGFNNRGIGYSGSNIPSGQYDSTLTTFAVSNSRSFGPGYSQTWKNLTGSRAAGVTYYNTSKRGIVVSATTGKTGGWTNISIVINGATACQQGGDQQGGFGGSNVNAIAIVPPGAAYYISASTGISHWAELSA